MQLINDTHLLLFKNRINAIHKTIEWDGMGCEPQTYMFSSEPTAPQQLPNNFPKVTVLL